MLIFLAYWDATFIFFLNSKKNHLFMRILAPTLSPEFLTFISISELDVSLPKTDSVTVSFPKPHPFCTFPASVSRNICGF